MIRSLKIFLSFILVFWLVSCGSKKSTLATTVNQKQEDQAQVVTVEKTNIVTEHYGDTLRGVMPLPKLGKLPIRYTVSSGGASLDLTVTDTSISYVAIPKHIGKTTASTEKTTQENTSKKVETVVEQIAKENKQPWRPPFWWYLIGLGLLIAAYYYLKNRLKPF